MQRPALLGLTLLALHLVVSGAGDAADELTTPDPAVALSPAALPRAGEHACAACHAEVTEEWSRTAHGIAWVDEHYQDALGRRRRAGLCHACHIPEPLLADGELARRPRARDEAAEPHHYGVSCATCHAGPGGAQLGPRGTPTEAHPSATSPFLAERSSELCAACHATSIGPVVGVAKDFLATDRAARGQSCVGCHMAPVERRWADGEDVPVRSGRSHLLQTPRDPAFARRAFALSLELGPAPRLVIANAAGHRVPGLNRRVFRFEIEAHDAAGASLATLTRAFDVEAYLPVDGRVEIALPAGTRSARVVGDHEDPRATAAVRFLEAELGP